MKRGARALAILFAALFCSYAWGPAEWLPQVASKYDPKSVQALAVAEAVALIPDDAVVGSRSRMSTHLTHRDKVYKFPTPFYATYWGDDSLRGQRLAVADEVEYVLQTPERLTGPGAEVFARLKAEEGFRQVFSKEGVVLVQKMAPASPESD